MALTKIFICFLLMFISANTYAIDVGTLTFLLDSKDEFVVKEVVNNTGSVNIYTVDSYEVKYPGKLETKIRPDKHDVLFNPKRFILNPGESKHVKFYYHGNKKKERYYRAIFNEFNIPKLNTDASTMYLSVSIDTILVVEPNDRVLNYKINYLNGTITNFGSSHFEFIIKQFCEQSDYDSISKKILPSMVFSSKLINKKNSFVIIYDGNFYFINNHCK